MQTIDRSRPMDGDAERRAAVAARDPSADGRFVYSVRTTGVYCRPSCASRAARPENVAFHATEAEAEAAGSGRAADADRTRRPRMPAGPRPSPVPAA